MDAPRIVNLPAEYSVDRHGAPIVAIIAHGTAGTDSREYLRTGGGRGVSIHVLIQRDGTIYRMVPDARGANHAGSPTSSFRLNGHFYSGVAVNTATLGFELENRQDGRELYTAAQLQAMGWQITEWRQTYGMLPILRHAELDPTRRRDPYQLPVNEMERWAALAVSSPLEPKRYRVRRVMISQRQEGDAPHAGELLPGEEVMVDKWYTNHLVHLQDGRGFVRLSDLEEIR